MVLSKVNSRVHQLFTSEGDMLIVEDGPQVLEFLGGDLVRDDFYVVILSGMTALLPPITLAVLG